MKKLWLVGVASVLLAQGCVTTAPIPLSEPAQEVTFVTARPAPRLFTNWTFFWFMPEIEPDAELEYTVIQPDGREYFRYKIAYRPAGRPIRSDFPPGLVDAGPGVFFGRPITVVFRVNKGTIRFTKGIKFVFETAAQEIPAVRR